MSKKERTTQTEILSNESVLLGKEHLRFLEDLIGTIREQSAYRATKAQLIRLFIETGMRRTYQFQSVKTEAELRQALSGSLDGDKTRITRR